MKAGEIEEIKSNLVQYLFHLSQDTHDVRGDWTDPSEKDADPLDQVNRQLELDFAMFRRSREGLTKGRILSALQKIDDGCYGVCEACEEQIPAKRLKVIPDASYCLQCQTRMERETA